MPSARSKTSADRRRASPWRDPSSSSCFWLCRQGVRADGRLLSEAARIKRAEGGLPRLDVAPPGDRTIVCITLETNLLFAKRLSAHLAQCPRSPLPRGGGAWVKTSRDYQALYNGRGCKQTIKGYRG